VFRSSAVHLAKLTLTLSFFNRLAGGARPPSGGRQGPWGGGGCAGAQGKRGTQGNFLGRGTAHHWGAGRRTSFSTARGGLEIAGKGKKKEERKPASLLTWTGGDDAGPAFDQGGEGGIVGGLMKRPWGWGTTVRGSSTWPHPRAACSLLYISLGAGGGAFALRGRTGLVGKKKLGGGRPGFVPLATARFIFKPGSLQKPGREQKKPGTMGVFAGTGCRRDHSIFGRAGFLNLALERKAAGGQGEVSLNVVFPAKPLALDGGKLVWAGRKSPPPNRGGRAFFRPRRTPMGPVWLDGAGNAPHKYAGGSEQGGKTEKGGGGGG